MVGGVVELVAAAWERVHERITGQFVRSEPPRRVREYVSGPGRGLGTHERVDDRRAGRCGQHGRDAAAVAARGLGHRWGPRRRIAMATSNPSSAPRQACCTTRPRSAPCPTGSPKHTLHNRISCGTRSSPLDARTMLLLAGWIDSFFVSDLNEEAGAMTASRNWPPYTTSTATALA